MGCYNEIIIGQTKDLNNILLAQTEPNENKNESRGNYGNN